MSLRASGARNRGVVLVGFAVAPFALEDLAARHADPADELGFGESKLQIPVADEVDDFFSRVMSKPSSCSGLPLSSDATRRIAAMLPWAAWLRAVRASARVRLRGLGDHPRGPRLRKNN